MLLLVVVSIINYYIRSATILEEDVEDEDEDDVEAKPLAATRRVKNETKKEIHVTSRAQRSKNTLGNYSQVLVTSRDWLFCIRYIYIYI